MALRAMENLAEAGFRNFKISVVMTRHNVPQLDEFAALADRFGAQLRITRLRPSGRGADVWPELHPTDQQQREIYAWLVDHGDRVLTGDSFFHLNALGATPLPGLNLCGAGRVVCLIDPIGDVYACPFAIHNAFKAGTVRAPGGFAEVWRAAPLFARLRTETSGGACRSCSAYSSCQGGCMAAKFFTGLPLDGPDPECVKGHGASALPGPDRGRAAAAGEGPLPPRPGSVPGHAVGARPGEAHATPARWRSRRERDPDRAHRPRAAPRAQPGDVRAARDQPRQAPGDLGAARRLLCAAGGGGQRRHRDRDRERAPLGLALRARAAGRRVRAGLGPGRRGLPATRRTGAGRARTRWDAGLLGVLPVRAVGTVAGTRRGIARAAHGDGGRARSTRWWTASPPPPPLAAGSGLDGVEINAGQHSLLRQFQSGLTNQRGDDYGQDRLLLTERVLRAVRNALGAGRVLGLRLCCDELAPWAGVTPEMAAEQAVRLAGQVDYLVVVRGSIYSVPATRPDLHTEPGYGIEPVPGRSGPRWPAPSRWSCRAAWWTPGRRSGRWTTGPPTWRR